ncbi:MAG TPA: hypothetical protein VE641_16800 [Chthoniobacterales bacterium]|nr:hypothetical protein [Chthoniobacterales bacterium]
MNIITDLYAAPDPRYSTGFEKSTIVAAGCCCGSPGRFIISLRVPPRPVWPLTSSSLPWIYLVRLERAMAIDNTLAEAHSTVHCMYSPEKNCEVIQPSSG